MQSDFFELLSTGERFLIAGAGGGFDVISGVPLHSHLRRSGKEVVFANLSFTDLGASNAELICDGTWLIDDRVTDLPSFPEKHLGAWLTIQDERPTIYAFSNEMGVGPLCHAYKTVIARHRIDTIILIDGGTDSLMRGDESRAGTIVEDACSIVAVAPIMPARSYLAAIGFGVEHELNHHACLENISSLMAEGHFLGCHAVSPSRREGADFLSVVEYLNEKMPDHKSIVINAIAAAMRGGFGDLHTTDRTTGAPQFINPLMTLYWFFRLNGIADALIFRDGIEGTMTMEEVAKEYQRFRLLRRSRLPRTIPLK